MKDKAHDGSVYQEKKSSTMYSMQDWTDSNLHQRQTAERQQQCAELALGDITQVGDAAVESALKETQHVDRKLEERVNDLEFSRSELQIQKETSVQELNALLVYNKRVQDALNACSEPLAITRKCIHNREGRIGVEMVQDPVNHSLKQEEYVIQHVQRQLRQTAADAAEQARLLRATQYSLDMDLGGKQAALTTDNYCKNLIHSSPGLSFDITPSLERSRTLKEWDFHTKQNITASKHEVKQSRNLRSNIDLLLHKIYEDISNHYEYTNRAFNKRIAETKEIKMKLEKELAETTRQANLVRCSLTMLQEPMAVTQQHIALASTRLSKRALRGGIEQCRDAAELQLEEELQQLYKNAEHLKQQQEQIEANLRCLRRTIEKLAEDLNKKINSLMIDEVQCMTQRLSMHFHVY